MWINGTERVTNHKSVFRQKSRGKPYRRLQICQACASAGYRYCVLYCVHKEIPNSKLLQWFTIYYSVIPCDTFRICQSIYFQVWRLVDLLFRQPRHLDRFLLERCGSGRPSPECSSWYQQATEHHIRRKRSTIRTLWWLESEMIWESESIQVSCYLTILWCGEVRHPNIKPNRCTFITNFAVFISMRKLCRTVTTIF